MPGGFLNHCHLEQSEGAKRPRCHERETAASAKPRPSLIIVILSEVRRSVATEREWKDLLSSAPTRLRQGILTAAH